MARNGGKADGKGRSKSEKKQAPTEGASPKPLKKRPKKRTQSYKIYLHKVSKRIDNELSMSVKTMEIMNSLVNDICEKLVEEAARLARLSKKSTLTEKEIEAATKLVLPRKLAKHSVSEGTEALTKFKCA